MATESKHTPGPWVADDTGELFPETAMLRASTVIWANGVLVAKVTAADDGASGGFAPRPDITRANAALIASAPTLLAAAEAVQAYFTEKYGGYSTKELARIRTALDTAVFAAKGGAK